MIKILISACLLGHHVRYDGTSKSSGHPAVERWRKEGRLVALCPEQAAGLGTPRPPAEIEGAMSGYDVLTGKARVFDSSGIDVSGLYALGARAALDLARENGCRYALLKENSPSCGPRFVYDGSFSGVKHDGSGVTAALLHEHGITVFSETEIDRLEKEFL